MEDFVFVLLIIEIVWSYCNLYDFKYDDVVSNKSFNNR